MPLNIQIPDRILSKSLPIIWRVGVPNTETAYYPYLTRIVLIPYINGTAGVPIEANIQQDAGSPTLDYFVEVDTQGLINAYFVQPSVKTDTIVDYDKEKAFSIYFTGNGNAHCAIFMRARVYYDDGTGEQQAMALDTDTIEVFPFITTIQDLESQRLLPYLFGANMRPLTYQKLVNAGFGTGTLPPQRGGLVLKNKGMGYFLSMLWSGGAGGVAVSFFLRNSATQLPYGSGTYHYTSAFPTHGDILTVSIAPDNIRAVTGWQSTTGGFLTNLNAANPAWDVVKVQISLPISMGGGAFVYIPLYAFYYTVDFSTNCYAPLYFLNTLGGFDAVTVDCCQILAEFSTNPIEVRTPRTWVQGNIYDRRTNPAQGGLSVQKNQIATEYRIERVDATGANTFYGIWGQLKYTRELYTNQNFYAEFPKERTIDTLYKLNIGKQKLVYRNGRNALPEYELSFTPANDFRTI